MDFLPEPLRPFGAYPQFILYILSPTSTKLNKLPIDYHTGHVANAHDPNIWMTIEKAIEENKKFQSQHGHGIGFVFTHSDPFWFLDIDNCVENNSWSAIAVNLMTILAGCAVEISLSKKGLHLFGTGIPPSHSNKNTEQHLEFYTHSRFVALTGFGALGNAATDATDLLSWLVDQYFPPQHSVGHTNAWTTDAIHQWNGPESNDELLARALRSQSARASFGKAASFKDLWECNLEILEPVYNNDESSYDAALAQHLAFWTGNNCERMLQLMRQSKLAREKWEREDYLPRTILSACAKQKEFLQDKAPQINTTPQAAIDELKPVDVTGGTFLSLEQQKELFKGCSYICDAHRILIPGGELLKPDQFKVMYGGFSFAMDYANQRVSRDAWEAFTQSQGFRAPRAHSSCFRPTEIPGKLIEDNGRKLANLWWPIITRRQVGDPEPFLNHLRKTLPDERDQLIALSYFAAVVQYKGVKFQWAPVFQGVEGNGKTLFSRCVAAAIGDKYCHFPKASEIAAKFNDWMFGKLFIGVEDIFVPDAQREVIEAIKPMITLDRQEIEPKGAAKFTTDICCNFILNSNHKEGVRKTENNRIFAPFYMAQQSLADLKRDGMDDFYFMGLYNWLKQGGYSIICEYLHTFSIPPEFNPTTQCQRAPITSTTKDAIHHGLGGIEQEVLEAIEQGLVGFRDGWISSIYLDRLLEQIRATRRIPHNKRRELLQALGYDWHPGLPNGRVNNTLLPDGGKPRLFVLHGHSNLQIHGAAEIAKAYHLAQTKSY